MEKNQNIAEKEIIFVVRLSTTLPRSVALTFQRYFDCHKFLTSSETRDLLITLQGPRQLPPSNNHKELLLRSFNGEEPGGPESTNKKVKERERGWYSLVYAESQQSPCMGLALFTKASGTLSMGWRRRAPSWEGLRSLGRKVNSESLCTPGDQPEKERERRREREREREKERHRDQSSDGAKVF